MPSELEGLMFPYFYAENRILGCLGGILEASWAVLANFLGRLGWILGAQEASKTPQEASKISQDGAKMGQDASKRAQEASKTGQEATKSAQDPPRRLKILPKWRQVAPKSIEKSALS